MDLTTLRGERLSPTDTNCPDCWDTHYGRDWCNCGWAIDGVPCPTCERPSVRYLHRGLDGGKCEGLKP